MCVVVRYTDVEGGDCRTRSQLRDRTLIRGRLNWWRREGGRCRATR